MMLSDFHAHTTYCDGKAAPSEMVAAAVGRGLHAFGLSGHAKTDIPNDWCMTEEGTALYLRDIAELKRKYNGIIQLYAGLEVDYFSPATPACDYRIGSVHFVRTENGFIPVDESRKTVAEAVKKEFHGDPYSYTSVYYETLAGVVEKTNADIIGHFDVVAKFNNSESTLFDEDDTRYTKAALGALHELVRFGKPFELNTGAYSRSKRKTPYPAPFILRELNRLGGRIILSSDAHDTQGICARFPEATEYARACGFTCAVALSGGKFVEYTL